MEAGELSVTIVGTSGTQMWHADSWATQKAPDLDATKRALDKVKVKYGWTVSRAQETQTCSCNAITGSGANMIVRTRKMPAFVAKGNTLLNSSRQAILASASPALALQTIARLAL